MTPKLKDLRQLLGDKTVTASAHNAHCVMVRVSDMRAVLAALDELIEQREVEA